ncbi:MAG: hypothetical protein HUJ96_09140 [Marinilabiliaceae bacterium]|nr:hypothetical protein [Marinilabiliaceae bacterium]
MALMTVYFPIVMGFVSAAHSEVECNEITTKIYGNDNEVLISAGELSKIVSLSFPDLKGRKLENINLNEIETTIEQNSPAVRRCECYATPGGVLHVEIEQRKPIMHVFTSGTSYYMDAEGYRIVSRGDTHAYALVVSGNVGAMLDGTELIQLCQYIVNDDFWKAQIEQVYVTDKSEYILVPRVGNHIVEFGTIDNMEEKFHNLHTLYTKGWDKMEWNLYKKVNLKYKGQIVCTKK